MGVLALAKGVRMNPRKVQEVAALVRGRTVAEALVILSHTPRRAALPVYKTIKSAAANAYRNNNMIPESLVITEISVTPGVRYKRYRPAAHGRALPFIRGTSHIRVIVDGEVKKSTKPTAKTEKQEEGDK